MGFIELQPPVKPKSTTGVRVSVTERWGLTVSLSGEARAPFELGKPVKALLDPDKAAPRLRIMQHSEGRFHFMRAPGPQTENGVLILRVGRQPQLPDVTFRGYDCTWVWSGTESVAAIDIDLPRELREVEHAGKNLSLPKIASLGRETA